MSDLYRKADEAGNAVQLNMTPTDDLVKRIEALEAKCVPATDSNPGLVQPDNDTIVILNGKLVATGLHMAWNAQTDYKPGWIVRGPDGKDYVAKEPSGPETNVGPKDPTDITNNQYWEEWSGGGGAKPVIIPAPTILGNLAPIAGQQYTYTFEVAGIALDSVAKFEIALSLNNQGTVTTRTAEVSASNNVATWPFQVPATMRNGDTITMQVVAVDKLGNRSDPAIANLSVGVVNVDAPTITSPTSGTVHYYMTSDLTVKTTAFTIRGATDAHVSTDWVISTDSQGQNVVAQASNSSDLTSHTFTKAELAAMRDGQTYYIRARHRSRTYGVSAWSAAVVIVAGKSGVNRPILRQPNENEELFASNNGIVFRTDEFSVSGGTDTHESTDWKICTDTTGATSVLSVMGSTDKLLHRFTREECRSVLAANTIYYAVARHKGTLLGYSPWSEYKKFTIAFGPSFKFIASRAMTNEKITVPLAAVHVYVNEKDLDVLYGEITCKAGDTVALEGWNNPLIFPSLTRQVNCFKEILTPLPDMGSYGMYSLFEACTSLQKIPEKLFSNNLTQTSYNKIFYGCTSLRDIPGNIFDGCQVKTCDNAFAHTGVRSIPDDLLQGSPCTSVQAIFAATNITEIPQGLFESLPIKEATFAFSSIGSLVTVPEDFLMSCTDLSDVSGLFMNCYGITSKVPELWRNRKITKYTECFKGCTNAANYADIPAGWK